MTVRYGQGGYAGQSMSIRAQQAYGAGEKPLRVLSLGAGVQSSVEASGCVKCAGTGYVLGTQSLCTCLLLPYGMGGTVWQHINAATERMWP